MHSSFIGNCDRAYAYRQATNGKCECVRCDSSDEEDDPVAGHELEIRVRSELGAEDVYVVAYRLELTLIVSVAKRTTD